MSAGEYWVVLAHFDMSVGVYGTPEGRPFRTELGAKRLVKKLENSYPKVTFLVARIEDGGSKDDD